MAIHQSLWGECFEVPPATTADDLLRMPDDGNRYEMYEGTLVREITSAGHGDICQRLGVELGIYARAQGAESDRAEHTLRPDISWSARAHGASA